MRSDLLTLAILLLLASCVTLHDPVDVDATYWRLDGKLSIQAGDRSRIVSIDWQQRGDSSDIHLNGPLGIGDVHIRAAGNQLVIDSGGSAEVYSLDQDLVIEGDSFRLPWKRLAYWVRGLQGPGMAPIEGEFSEDDWSVSVLDSDNTGPKLIVLSHPDVRPPAEGSLVATWCGKGNGKPDLTGAVPNSTIAPFFHGTVLHHSLFGWTQALVWDEFMPRPRTQAW